eukprot:maker-scaffold541_size141817-snap-gene-0.35 protein:Tk05610 transcript:maker-scaffold541_size141817-snap-gene-0.35-mRNA-1 annotation:"agmatine deiminase"
MFSTAGKVPGAAALLRDPLSAPGNSQTVATPQLLTRTAAESSAIPMVVSGKSLNVDSEDDATTPYGTPTRRCLVTDDTTPIANDEQFFNRENTPPADPVPLQETETTL